MHGGILCQDNSKAIISNIISFLTLQENVIMFTSVGIYNSSCFIYLYLAFRANCISYYRDMVIGMCFSKWNLNTKNMMYKNWKLNLSTSITQVHNTAYGLFMLLFLWGVGVPPTNKSIVYKPR